MFAAIADLQGGPSNMKLIQEYQTVRVYQLDFRIYVDARGGKIYDIWDGKPPRIKPEWELAEGVRDLESGNLYLDSVNKIAISDAHTHSERLVFPAYTARNKETGEELVNWDMVHIAGYMTFMTHGGDISSMKRPEVYVRLLRLKNHFYNMAGRPE